MNRRDITDWCRNFVWQDGRWWRVWGSDYTLTAPTVELISERLGKYLPGYRMAFNKAVGQWVATPIRKPVNS